MQIAPVPKGLTQEQCDCILQTAAECVGYKAIPEFWSKPFEKCTDKTINGDALTHIHIQLQ